MTARISMKLARAGSSTQPSQALLPKPPQATAAPAATQESERWSVKHAPVTEADLVVAKKKVTSIKEWLEATRDAPMGGGRPQRVLLLTGAHRLHSRLWLHRVVLGSKKLTSAESYRASACSTWRA